MYPPDLDSVGGRSYKQSSQTAGALGGRRDVVQWHSTEDVVSTSLLCAFRAVSPLVKWAVWNTGTSSWEGDLLPSCGSNDRIMKSRPLTSSLWFILSFRFSETFDGCVRRTKNAGATWSNMAVPETDYDWQDIVRAPDGRLWAITQKDNSPSDPLEIKIWYSDDDGDSWTESHAASLADQEIYYIAVHPTDSDIIVAFGYADNEDAVTYVTINKGVSWTRNIATNVSGNESPSHEDNLIILDTGRLVTCRPEFSTENSGIMVSDDNGATWTFKLTKDTRFIDEIHGPVKNLSGSRIFVLFVPRIPSETTRILESTDRGENWVEYDNLVPFPANEVKGGQGGIAYNITEDALYIGNDNDLDGQRIIMKMNPAVSTGEWVDVSGDLGDIDAALFRFNPGYGQRIAAIPS